MYKQAENLECNTSVAEVCEIYQILVQNRSAVTDTGHIYSGYIHRVTEGSG